MKITYKVSLAAACVLLVITSLLSPAQISQVRRVLRTPAEQQIRESSTAVVRQIENWLNDKLHLLVMTARHLLKPLDRLKVSLAEISLGDSGLPQQLPVSGKDDVTEVS